MARTTLRHVKPGVYGVRDSPTFIGLSFGFFGEGMRGWAYRYTAGAPGVLVHQQDFAEMAAVGSVAVISYSPLVFAVQASSGPLYAWNVDAAALVTVLTHPVSGYAWKQLASGGDGYAYWIEIETASIGVGLNNVLKLFRVNASGTVAQITQLSDELEFGNLGADYGGTTFCDGVAAFLPVTGSAGRPGGEDGGIVQIPIAGGGRPVFRTSADWLPGDPLDESAPWRSWYGGHRIPTTTQALGFSGYDPIGNPLDPNRVYLLRGQLGGDFSAFASSPLIDPVEGDGYNGFPSAGGNALSLYQRSGSRVALVALEPTDAAAVTWHDVEPDPGSGGLPLYMIPA